MKYYLVFDAGTGAGRCALFDFHGNQVATAYKEWDYQTPPGCAPDGRVFNPEIFWHILAQLSREVISISRVEPRDIIAVSTTSQREGMVFLDRNGKVIYAGPNIDNRGIGLYEPLLGQEAKVRQITGLGLFSLFGPARLLWFKKHDRKTYDRIHVILMMSDWIAYQLCGEPSSECSVACSSQFLDIAQRTWSPDIPQIFDLKDDIFPPLHDAGSPIGSVTKQASMECGLVEGTAVIAGGGDTQIGMLGIGINNQECISAIAGTSTPVMATIKSPFIDPSRCVSTNCHVTPGVWTLESNAGMTGMSYRWIRDAFAADLIEKGKVTGKEPYESINELAEELPPGSDGWKAYLGAFRSGARNNNAGGFYFPLSWILDGFDRRHLFRSALETMAFAVRANFEQLAIITNGTQSELRVGGGQTKSTLFNTILANTLNLPIVVFSVKESTSLGAAICAAKGSGTFSSFSEAIEEMVHVDEVVTPNHELVSAYNEAYRDWVEFGEYLAQYKKKEI